MINRRTFLTLIFTNLILASCGSENDSSSVNELTISTKLSYAEKTDLLFMWEEEKMARDVYSKFYDLYQSKVFSNISSSEQEHMDAIKNLISQVGVELPIDENNEGVFSNQEIQNLYNELISRGNESVEAAYQVGVDIEELDIEDLNERISAANDNAIKTTYNNLLSGSYNHLAAFKSKQ